MSIMTITLQSGDIQVVVDETCGARLASLQVSHKEFLVTQADSPLDWGVYPMVPFAGRVRDGRFVFNDNTYQLSLNSEKHALHGTVFNLPWTIESISDSEVVLSTSTGEAWPFRAMVWHHIDVSHSRVRCTLTIRADEPMPVQLGWHPWFKQPTRAITDFASMLRRDSDGITTLDRVDPCEPPVDDCFFEPNSWPRIKAHGRTLEIASDCPYWVRYDAPSGDICIEPQSGPPNGLNTKPLVLEAGQQFSRWMEMRLLPTQ